MCGISFSIGSSNANIEGLLRHRGPDEEYQFHFGNCNLTFNRLAVTGGIDGTAPVISEDGRWICFLNGEIYNYKSLRRTLNRSEITSDTRVVAEGLSKFGLDFLVKLEGMYALVIFDTQQKRLYVYRDPLGEKPLFYSKTKDGFEAASEFSALLKKLKRKLILNDGAIEDYFRFGYIEEPWTIDREIWAFPKGMLCEISPSSELRIIRQTVNRESLIDCELGELIRILNSEIVPSDVGQVILLSGGVDSASLLTGLSHDQREKTVALTLSTQGSVNLGEVKSAKKSARKLGFNHEILDWQPKDLALNLMELSNAIDQPHADMSSVAYYSIFKHINELGIKVAITGHGPDEMFWGYPWYNERLMQHNSKEVDRVYWKTPSDLTHLLDGVNSIVEKKRLSESDKYLKSNNDFQRYRAEIVHSYLAHNALRQSDRLAMYWSVEPRTPYADHRLYIWAQENANRKSDLNKANFKKALSRNPWNRLNRRAKQGFDIGMMGFLNSEKFRKSMEEIKLNLMSREIPGLNISPAKNFGAREKYRLAMLEYWLQKHE